MVQITHYLKANVCHVLHMQKHKHVWHQTMHVHVSKINAPYTHTHTHTHTYPYEVSAAKLSSLQPVVLISQSTHVELFLVE